jgi:hypothetical protein
VKKDRLWVWPELIAGRLDHGFGEDARAPQVVGVSGIEPLLGGRHQNPAIACALGQNLSRQFETFGERRRKISNPWDVER